MTNKFFKWSSKEDIYYFIRHDKQKKFFFFKIYNTEMSLYQLFAQAMLQKKKENIFIVNFPLK